MGSYKTICIGLIALSTVIFLFSFYVPETKKNSEETPLVCVVKLISAEEHLDFSEARKLLDVESAYSKYITDTTISADSLWRELVLFQYALGQDKRFTNSMKFYNYTITESCRSKRAEVSFQSKDTSQKIKEIKYKLELRQSWTVVDVQYIK